MSYFMGIDSGTSGIKAIVLDDTGKILGTGYCECNLITPKPNWVEQNPLDWWHACSEAAKKAAASSGVGMEIEAIGFSGQMQGTTLMDANMDPIGNCMIWMDQRCGAEADEMNAKMDHAEMLEITGSYCLPSYWVPKLMWLEKNKPEDFAKIHTILFTKDYLRYMMTGEATTEVTDASLTFLLDLKTRTWSDRMFEVTGLSKAIVPEKVLESQEIGGYLKEDVAALWGMKAGIPVVAGGGDQPAGGIGSGVVKSGVVASTIGTSGVVFGCCDVPFKDENQQGMYSLCHSLPGKYCFLGCTLGAGGSFKWMRDTLFADKKEALAAEGKDVYDYMTSLAEKAPVGSEGLCFLPYLNGEGTPHVDPDARGVFFGLSYRSGLGEMCRAVMEGVTFSLRDTVEIMRESVGLEITEIRAMGGGAKSALWRQIQADIYNAKVVTMNMEEGPAAGAAMMAAVGAGRFASLEEASEAILKIETVTEPIPENVAMYDEYYKTYRQVYQSLKADFKAQAKIVEKFVK
ncbi:xylulokinase [Chakrabartyella piscis]|uniref:xylulokinase n=1 Tax=Chakrabartyella piscis TaxID=2918914 RepID=UPI0029585A01|nr:xylulokinase [Chakrabartyella piscis]